MSLERFRVSGGTGYCYEIDGCAVQGKGDLIAHMLDVCGCGDPESVYRYILKVLTVKELHHGYHDDQGIVFTRYVLDRLGYLEHGTSIGFCWVTDKGTQLIEDLQEVLGEE